MSNVAVIGGQWGDEGKGKIVDWLSSRADVVVRFQGGHNAGHTLVIDGVEHKLSLLPSGVVRPGKQSYIGNGVVVDPWAFFAELERVAQKGVQVTPDNLKIAENVVLILPSHGVVDRAREAVQDKIGTTGRGIGPAYEDKIARRAVRLCDLADPALLKHKLEQQLTHHNILLEAYGVAPMAATDVLEQLMALAPKLLPFAAPVWRELDAAMRAHKKILFEGAQGTMLDIDHGTYPYVTSSTTVAANAASGAGIAPHLVGTVLGICKAYTTRVGSGPFPTEELSPIGEHIGARGKEFGTVTGRKRRCGWFDAVMVRQAAKLGGITGIALTKLDVLDELETLKVCTGYRWRGQTLDYLPANQTAQAEIEPIYEGWDGWQKTTRGARSWAELPSRAVKYIRRLEELVQVPVTLLSTSPERDDTILMQDPFTP